MMEMSGGVGGGGVVNKKVLLAQQSTVWTRRQNAVCVRRAVKTYGPKSAPNVILDNLNMTVPKGCIYGLLGASGCGKTTLLSCIVGRRRLGSGEIWVLGGKPGSRGSGVPGPRIGYMPQELALYCEFSIRETLIYFGWVAGMTTSEIDERIDFLSKLLLLPSPNKAVKHLSGGQKRRVSFAAALLHSPELLILDEPTVGLDPLLRQAIWDHLVEITSDKTTTAIITTHYIDETKQAHTIGLMRGGKFLAEESPASLLQKHNTDSLEEIFLKLSLLQNRGKRRRSSIASDIVAATASAIPELQDEATENIETNAEISGEFGDNMTRSSSRMALHVVQELTTPVDPIPPEEDADWSWRDYLFPFTKNHMKALVWKNALWMVRNVGTMIFMFALPISQIIIFCLSIGGDPIGLKLAVVNNEVPFNKDCFSNSTCSYDKLSCKYLEQLERKHHRLVHFADKASAIEAVEKGAAWGAVEIPERFSPLINLRIELGRDANETVIDGSEISVTMDMTNHQISFLLRKDIIYSLKEFADKVTSDCKENAASIYFPIRFNNPIYGPVTPNFTDFAAPGVIVTIAFFLAVGLATGTMIIERNEGILERGLVSGITGVEILAGHVITQFLNMAGQGIVVVLCAVYVFNVTNEGDLLLVMILTVLSGVCGMVFGFLVSCVSDNERNATYIALGSFLPFVMLCGIIWPVEGMHQILKTISYFLPLTLSTESMRSIFARGWGFDEPTVYAGFVSVIIWIFVFMSATVLILKFKKG